jgi:hypothetical protein
MGCIVAAGPAGGGLDMEPPDIPPPDMESGAEEAGGAVSGEEAGGAVSGEEGAAGAPDSGVEGAAGAASCANTAPPARAVKANAVAARVVNFMVMVPYGCSLMCPVIMAGRNFLN